MSPELAFLISIGAGIVVRNQFAKMTGLSGIEDIDLMQRQIMKSTGMGSIDEIDDFLKRSGMSLGDLNEALKTQSIDDILKGLDEVDALKKIDKQLRMTLSSSEVEEHAFNAIRGANNSYSVVIGKFAAGSPASYDEVAKSMDAQYFSLDNWSELRANYSEDEIWKINEKFWDIQISSGREIYLSHNPNDYFGDASFYSKELNYLQNNGYRFVKEGDLWHAVR